MEGMIGYLRGVVKEVSKTGVILLCGEVGYLVKVPERISFKIKTGEKREFYIYTHVREDILALFGFESKDELNMFELLIGVSGVGPKIAMAILSNQTPEKIKKAILDGEIEVFTSISGIGKKNAQRIIVELRSKLGSNSEEIDFESNETEVIDVLVNWGFSKKQAFEAVKKLDPTLSDEEKIKLSLKNLNERH